MKKCIWFAVDTVVGLVVLALLLWGAVVAVDAFTKPIVSEVTVKTERLETRDKDGKILWSKNNPELVGTYRELTPEQKEFQRKLLEQRAAESNNNRK